MTIPTLTSFQAVIRKAPHSIELSRLLKSKIFRTNWLFFWNFVAFYFVHLTLVKKNSIQINMKKWREKKIMFVWFSDFINKNVILRKLIIFFNCFFFFCSIRRITTEMCILLLKMVRMVVFRCVGNLIVRFFFFDLFYDFVIYLIRQIVVNVSYEFFQCLRSLFTCQLLFASFGHFRFQILQTCFGCFSTQWCAWIFGHFRHCRPFGNSNRFRSLFFAAASQLNIILRELINKCLFFFSFGKSSKSDCCSVFVLRWMLGIDHFFLNEVASKKQL